MYNLKPCPFCGTVPYGDDEDIVYPVGRVEDLYQCVCTNPECGIVVLGLDTKSAIDHWNTRKYDLEVEDLKITNEVTTEYNIDLRNELTDAYKHISVLEQYMDILLTRAYELEIERDETNILHK